MPIIMPFGSLVQLYLYYVIVTLKEYTIFLEPRRNHMAAQP